MKIGLAQVNWYVVHTVVLYCVLNYIFFCVFRVFSWGWGVHGQLGHGSVENQSVPITVSTFDGQVSFNIFFYYILFIFCAHYLFFV